MTTVTNRNGYTIKCECHNYVTLEFEDKFVFCLDNDSIRAEEIIYRIEKRTRSNFSDIPIKGCKDDFQGLLFFNGGWKRDFWEQFPSHKEIESYMKIKNCEFNRK